MADTVEDCVPVQRGGQRRDGGGLGGGDEGVSAAGEHDNWGGDVGQVRDGVETVDDQRRGDPGVGDLRAQAGAAVCG